MDVDQFRTKNGRSDNEGAFERENSKTLAVTVDDRVMAKAGSMVASEGDLNFTGRASAEDGFTGVIKEAVTNEGTPIMTIEGRGTAYLADNGKKIEIIHLSADDTLTVNGDDILGFEESVSYSIGTIDSLAGSFAGGFTNVYLEGPGAVAITTYGDPLVFSPPVSTDPMATVAWSQTSPDVEVNRSLSDMIGQESGERYQMNFTGDGVVIVQPYEEAPQSQSA